MSTPEYRYTMSVTIRITGTETKKGAVRDAILGQLQTALNAGNIDEATWSVSQTLVPEGGIIK